MFCDSYELGSPARSVHFLAPFKMMWGKEVNEKKKIKWPINVFCSLMQQTLVSPWLVSGNSEYGIFFICQKALILPGSW